MLFAFHQSSHATTLDGCVVVAVLDFLSIPSRTHPFILVLARALVGTRAQHYFVAAPSPPPPTRPRTGILVSQGLGGSSLGCLVCFRLYDRTEMAVWLVYLLESCHWGF